MSSAFEVFRILIVYGEVVQQLPMLAAVFFVCIIIYLFFMFVNIE